MEAFKADPSSAEFLNTKKAVWEQTAKLSTFVGRGAAQEFDAIFYPGGVGPMFDLATDAESQALIAEFVAAGKPVASVCHGPAAFTGVPGLLAGKRVTGFSNAEEEVTGVKDHLNFLLETKLREVGGRYEKAAEPWGEHVVVEDGGKLITGQNPASSKGVGEALAKAIGA